MIFRRACIKGDLRMFSPEVSAHSWAIWILSPGGVRELFDSRRLYESRGEAESVCAAMADWFHRGEWCDRVLDALPPDDQDELFALRRGFKADGVPLGMVRVGAKPATPTLYDAEDEDEEDTSLESDVPLYLAAADYDLI